MEAPHDAAPLYDSIATLRDTRLRWALDGLSEDYDWTALINGLLDTDLLVWVRGTHRGFHTAGAFQLRIDYDDSLYETFWDVAISCDPHRHPELDLGIPW